MKDPAAIVTTRNDYLFNIIETIVQKQFQLTTLVRRSYEHYSYEDHTSIIKIKSNLDNVSDKCDFKKVHEKEVKREIMNLNSKQHVTVLYQPKFVNSFATRIFP